jgi:hypothetical protein
MRAPSWGLSRGVWRAMDGELAEGDGLTMLARSFGCLHNARLQL